MKSVDRRTVTRAAVWSVPAVVLVSAAPAHAVSVVEVGAYRLAGTCGTVGLLGPGFLLTAGPTAPLPAGTTVLVNGSGIANIGLFSPTPANGANVAVLSSNSRLITLTAPLAAGAQLAFRTTLSTSVAFTLNGATTLPDGYAGTGSKPTGSVSSTLVLCSVT